jgi:hypothetical protein
MSRSFYLVNVLGKFRSARELNIGCSLILASTNSRQGNVVLVIGSGIL